MCMSPKSPKIEEEREPEKLVNDSLDNPENKKKRGKKGLRIQKLGTASNKGGLSI